MFDWFETYPGRLYVAATLLPLAAFAQPWMPDSQFVVADCHARQPPATLAVAETKVGCVGDHDVPEHRVVDVAAQRDDPGRVELHGRVGLTAIQRQLKTLRWRKRIHLVADRIAVRKFDPSAHRNHDHLRIKGAVHLIHRPRAWVGRRILW